MAVTSGELLADSTRFLDSTTCGAIGPMDLIPIPSRQPTVTYKSTPEYVLHLRRESRLELQDETGSFLVPASPHQ
jgi:hypothetical protein